MVYHVLNRGNGRMRIFHKAEDYEAFERVLAEGLERYRWTCSPTASCQTIGTLLPGRRPTKRWDAGWGGWA